MADESNEDGGGGEVIKLLPGNPMDEQRDDAIRQLQVLCGDRFGVDVQVEIEPPPPRG